MNNKDLIIAILVAYVVTDIVLSIMIKNQRPLLFEQLSRLMRVKSSQVWMAVGLGALAGFATYYLLAQNAF